ncbi:MAG: Iron-sulfur cluster assembly ATPase protein SufC, partial [uncultured Sphingomonas sp.]
VSRRDPRRVLHAVHPREPQRPAPRPRRSGAVRRRVHPPGPRRSGRTRHGRRDAQAASQRRLFRRRKEAGRDGPDGHHAPALRRAGRDRQRPRHRRAADRRRGHQPDHARARPWGAADHPLPAAAGGRAARQGACARGRADRAERRAGAGGRARARGLCGGGGV